MPITEENIDSVSAGRITAHDAYLPLEYVVYRLSNSPGTFKKI